jgi:hypothetical protein
LQALVYAIDGSRDHRGERRGFHVRLGESQVVPDPELFGDGSFNAEYRDCFSLEDCKNKWDAKLAAQIQVAMLPPLEAAPWFPTAMSLDGAFAWVAAILAVIATPDPTGRTVIWCWEAAGSYWKSRFTKYAIRMLGAMATAGGIAEEHVANQVKGYIELRGHGPKRIIIDRPRDADSVKWGMVENLKNGYVPALPATPTLPPPGTCVVNGHRTSIHTDAPTFARPAAPPPRQDDRQHQMEGL